MKIKFGLYSIIIILGALFSMPQSTHAQATQYHFFIHGWTVPLLGSGAGQVTVVAGDMQARFGWASNPTLPDYSSIVPPITCGVPCVDGIVPNGVHAQLWNVSTSHWVGLGYSEGGEFARYEALTYGSGFINGLVTDHTPNNGTWIGDFSHRANFVARLVDAEARMLRGDFGILTWIFNGVINALEIIVDYIGLLVNALATVLIGGLAQDAAPGSTVLNSINATPQPAGIARVTVWGETQPPYIGNLWGDANGVGWAAAESTARRNSHDNDNLANGVHPHWWCPWRYIQQAWYRSRAGDWSATANGMDDAENAWEDNTAGRGVTSDGLVGTASQQAIPTPSGNFQDNAAGFFNTPHGAAVSYTPNTIDVTKVGYQIGLKIYNALTTAGAY